MKSKKVIQCCLALAFFTQASQASYPNNANNLTERLSPQCALDTNSLEINLKNFTLWAMQMWEASAKEESGILQGNNYQLGDFDECLTPHTVGNRYKFQGFKRQYCLIKLKLHSLFPTEAPSYASEYESALDAILSNGSEIVLKRNELYWALCSPASCSVQDLEILLNEYEYFTKVSSKFNLSHHAYLDDKSCQVDTTDNSYTPGSIAFICCFGILCILAAGCTAHHWYTEYRSKKSEKKYVCPDLIKSFSVLFNLRQLSYRGEKGSTLESIYGIRVFSIFFILFGHRLGTTLQGPIENREFVESVYTNHWYAVLIHHQETFVDTFFVLSGTFTMYILLKYSMSNRFNFIQIVVSRYSRLVPLYAFVIFFTATLLPQMGSGPLWNLVMETEGQNCRANWWTNLLMINNYVHIENMCMVHAWYIPCDFHYFVIATLLCGLVRKPSTAKYGFAIMGFLLFLSILIPILVTYFLKLPPVLFFYNDFLMAPRTHQVFQNVYIKSHTRMSPYILGLFTGYILHKYKDKASISMMKSTMGCIVTVLLQFGVSASLIFFLDLNTPYEPLNSAFFAGLFRPAKALCTCIFILCCVFGDVPLITAFLGWAPMVILGKLTFAVYLMHMGLQLRAAASLRQPIYVNPYNMYQTIISDSAITFGLALIGYLLVEAPSNMLLKIMLMPAKKKVDPPPLDSGHVNDGIELDSNSKERA